MSRDAGKPPIVLGSSAVVGEHALIPGLAAAVLVRVVGDWRRSLPRGMAPDDLAEVEAAVGAMRAAAAGWYARLEAERLPGPGSGEGPGKGNTASSETEWIPTREAAALLDRTDRRVRQLADERKLESRSADGRLYFLRSQVLSRATRTGTSGGIPGPL